jgi:hypothetical protein
MVEKRNPCTLLMGKAEVRRPLGEPGNRWERRLGELRWGGVAWIGLAQDRDQRRVLVNAVMKLEFHKVLGSS